MSRALREAQIMLGAQVDVEDGPESYGKRLTRWRRRMLNSGVHPITGVKLLAHEQGHTCGDCANHVLQGGTSGRYHKCRLKITGGPKTDLRVGWPACIKWAPIEGGDT